jgi:hypothetical protein
MGGKANCLCPRGIWEAPKPRYREETKPAVGVAWDHFLAGLRSRARRLIRAERCGEFRGVPRPRSLVSGAGGYLATSNHTMPGGPLS